MRKQTDPKPEKTIDQMVAEYNHAAMVMPAELDIPTTPQEAEEMLQKAYWKSLAKLDQILDNPFSKDEAVIRAAKDIADRLLGKPKDNNPVDAKVPMVVNIIRFGSSAQKGITIDGNS